MSKETMRKLLIGSRALAYWNPALPVKPSTDWDIISDEPITGAEWHDSMFLNNERMFHYNSDCTIDFNGQPILVCNMMGLAIIKRSHLWRDIGFQKHITHYHKFGLEQATHWFISKDKEVLEQRIALTKEVFPQGNPNLMQKVEDFFDDYVTKKYDHDYLHTLFAYQDKPLYTKLQKNPELAWCSKDLWYNLNSTEKLQCIAEEVQVIATERFLVPKDWKYSARLAYSKALDKVCTTLCSGYFRDHAIDYYSSVMQLFDQQRFDNVKHILLKGE
jgi:hypothetical protein